MIRKIGIFGSSGQSETYTLPVEKGYIKICEPLAANNKSFPLHKRGSYIKHVAMLCSTCFQLEEDAILDSTCVKYYVTCSMKRDHVGLY